jgi:hypothetical protein
MRLFSLLICLLSSAILQSQDDATALRYLSNLAQVRTELLRQTKADLVWMSDFIALVDSVDAIEVSKSKLPAERNWQLSMKKSERLFSIWSPRNLILDSLATKTIQANTDLWRLINKGVLNSKYPFIISREPLNEYLFYELSPSDTVFEQSYGGDFMVWQMANLAECPSVFVICNCACKPGAQLVVDSIMQMVMRPAFGTREHILGVDAKTNLAGFERNSLDKIILRRQAYLYQKNPSTFRNLRKSLKPDGVFFIKQDKADRGPDARYKALAQTWLGRKKTIKWFERHGFKLLRQMETEEYYVLAFRKKK